MKKIIYLFFLFAIASCARLPIQTLTLTDAIIAEGKRMHELNLSLLDKMFEQKRAKIDGFIRNEYTPVFLEEFKKKIPAGVDFEKEFPNMIQSIIPQINSRRDLMQGALETQRIKLTTKLGVDFIVFDQATSELKKLIESGIKVNEERRNAFEQVKVLTQNKIDLNQVETEIDKFIIKSGDLGGNINDLNSSINSLLNN